MPLSNPSVLTSLPYVALVMLFPLSYYLTHASMDYRQPIEPQIAVMVSVGLIGLQEQEAFSTEEDDDFELGSEFEPAV